MNRPIYLGLSILELSKILMYYFCYDYIKTKCEEKRKLCYMGTGSFIMYIIDRMFIKALLKTLKQGLILEIKD